MNLENFPKKGNLKYQIFSLDLLGPVSLGVFLVFLFKYLINLSINLGGYSFFCKLTLSFQSLSENHPMCVIITKTSVDQSFSKTFRVCKWYKFIVIL